MKKFFFLMSLLVLANVHAGELYRSIDKEGKVHYGDRPLEGTEDVEQLKLAPAPVPEENLPYETQRAKQNFPVTLYSFRDCGATCQQARDLLSARGIPFTEKSLATREEIDTFHKDSGDSKLPAATIGSTWLRGFQAEQWNKELDFAGYPKKDLTYRPKPATPPTPPAQPTQPAQ
jgi:hypothetical protein